MYVYKYACKSMYIVCMCIHKLGSYMAMNWERHKINRQKQEKRFLLETPLCRVGKSVWGQACFGFSCLVCSHLVLFL